MRTLILWLALASVAAAQTCPGDLDGDRVVDVSELVRGVNAALSGCGPTYTPTPSEPPPTPTPGGQHCPYDFTTNNLAIGVACRYLASPGTYRNGEQVRPFGPDDIVVDMIGNSRSVRLRLGPPANWEFVFDATDATHGIVTAVNRDTTNPCPMWDRLVGTAVITSNRAAVRLFITPTSQTVGLPFDQLAVGFTDTFIDPAVCVE